MATSGTLGITNPYANYVNPGSGTQPGYTGVGIIGDGGGAISPTGTIPATTQPPSTINASSLGGVSPLNVPANNPSTVSSGISGIGDGAIANHQSAIDTQLQQQESQAQANDTGGKNAIQSIMDLIKGEPSTANTLSNQANIPDYTKSANDAYAALNSSKLAQKQEIDAINNNPQGYSTQGLSSAVAAVNRKYAQTQADLSITLDTANHFLTSAQAGVDAKMKLITDSLSQQLSASEYFQTQNHDDLSKAEQAQLAQQQTDLKQQIADKAAVGDALKALIATGQRVTPDQVKAITGATDGNDAYSKIAQLGFTLQNPLDNKLKTAQIGEANANIAQSQANTRKTLSEIVGAGGLSTGQQKTATTISDNWVKSQESTQFQTVQDNYQVIQNINTTDPASQAASLAAFVQMAVPGSKSLRGSANVITSMFGNKLGNTLIAAERTYQDRGTMTPGDVQSVKDAAQTLYDAKAKSYESTRASYQAQMEANGITGHPELLLDLNTQGKITPANVTVDKTKLSATDSSGTIVFPTQAAFDQFIKDNKLQ